MSSYTDQFKFEVERNYYIALRNANKLFPQELMNVISMIFVLGFFNEFEASSCSTIKQWTANFEVLIASS